MIFSIGDYVTVWNSSGEAFIGRVLRVFENKLFHVEVIETVDMDVSIGTQYITTRKKVSKYDRK